MTARTLPDGTTGARRTLRALSISWLIVASIIGVAYASQNAAATTVDYYGLNGYQGNSAIYLTTGVNARPYVLPTIYNTSYETSNMYGIKNTLNVSAGQSPRPTTSTLVFNEQYNPTSMELVITIPIVAGGASQTNWYTPPSPPCPSPCPTHIERVAYQTVSIDVSLASPNTHTDIITSWNSGINVTGPNYRGISQDEALINLGFDAISFSKLFGFAVGYYQTMKDLQGLSGVEAYNPGVVGNGKVFETFGTKGGSQTQNVFVSQLRLQVTIPRADFMSYVPRLDISALNRVTNINQYPQVVVDGAKAQVGQIKSAAAVTLTGTVTALGSPFANQDITLSTHTEGPYVGINYHLKTDQDGKYRFFAEPNKPYTLSASYSTSFGPAVGQTSWTTLSTPDSQTVDLILPVSGLYGDVKNSAGTPLGATVKITSPSSITFTTTADAGGHYSLTTNALGTHTLVATFSGYVSRTTSVSVGAFNAVYRAPDFTFPARIEGYVKNSGGGAINLAGLKTTSPSGTTYTAFTDASGYYSLNVYGLGTYSLTASACGYGSQTKSVGVPAENTAYRVDFVLSTGSGDIAPIYVTADGARVQGASVSISGCGLTYSATTDSAGMVPGKTGLTGGEYTVTASWTDWSTCTGDAGQVHWIWKGSLTVGIPPNAAPTVVLKPDHSVRCPV